MEKYKLYVWENVLKDYTCGIMFALAESKEQAIKLIKEKYSKTQRIEDVDNSMVGYELIKIKPLIITEPSGFYIWGGS